MLRIIHIRADIYAYMLSRIREQVSTFNGKVLMCRHCHSYVISPSFTRSEWIVKSRERSESGPKVLRQHTTSCCRRTKRDVILYSEGQLPILVRTSWTSDLNECVDVHIYISIANVLDSVKMHCSIELNNLLHISSSSLD